MRCTFPIIGCVMMLKCLTILTFCSSAFSQDKAAAIDRLLQLNHDYGHFNGTVLVSEGGICIFKKGYGLANMEWNIPNQPDTKFRLGSITKQFTSMLVMQLVEEGLIDLDGTISEYLPEYRKDSGEVVTIHQLLTHTSGIPSYTSLPNFGEVSRDPYTVKEFVAKYCSGDLNFAPGTRFSYSNSGYFLLGAITEEITGKSYQDLLKEKIFDPLGMKDSGYDHFENIISKRADGYIKTVDGYKNAAYSDMSVPYAAGAIYSTAEDLFLWDQALYTAELLSKKYRDLMFTPYLENYAYGWWHENFPLSESEDSVEVIQHVGGIRGFYNLITRQMDRKHLVVLLNNTARFDATELQKITIEIINILHNKPYDLPKRSITDVLCRTIKQKNISTAIEQYRELKDESFDDYEFIEIELDWLGYELLGKGLVDDAIEIFKLAVEVYPESFNAYDSLADAYRRKGEKDLAIKNYEKSLRLNPENRSAKYMLKILSEQD